MLILPRRHDIGVGSLAVGPKQADGVSILQGASRPTGASAADQGVRPTSSATSSADFSLPTKTLGIAQEWLRHNTLFSWKKIRGMIVS